VEVAMLNTKFLDKDLMMRLKKVMGYRILLKFLLLKKLLK